MARIRGLQDIEMGQQLWVYVDGEAYRTMVADTAPGRLATAYPFPPQAPFSPGMEVVIRFVSGSRVIKVTGKALERTGHPDLLWIGELGPIEEIERRRAFRVWSSVPAAVRAGKGEGEWIEGHTEDVSAGGFRARFLGVQPDIREGDQVDFRVSLPSHTWAGEAMVRRSEEIREAGCWEIAVQWIGAREAETDRVIAFLFQEQLALRKKGLL